FATAQPSLRSPLFPSTTLFRSIVSITTILFVFLKVQGSLWDSLANQIGLRIRERRFLEEKERMVRTAGSVQRLESLGRLAGGIADRKSTRLNSSHVKISYAVFC